MRFTLHAPYCVTRRYDVASAQSLPEIYKPDPKFPEGFIDLDLRFSQWIA